MLKELSKHYGSDAYPDRYAIVYYNTKKELYEVHFFESKQLIEMKDMVSKYDSGSIKHNETYADNAAENWCLGYVP